MLDSPSPPRSKGSSKASGGTGAGNWDVKGNNYRRGEIKDKVQRGGN